MIRADSSVTPTSFPGSLILTPEASEERPWKGLVTCFSSLAPAEGKRRGPGKEVGVTQAVARERPERDS